MKLRDVVAEPIAELEKERISKENAALEPMIADIEKLLVQQLEAYGVEAIFLPIDTKDSRVYNKKLDEVTCHGSFDSDKLEFVATRREDLSSYTQLILHEFCHFLQWRDNRVLWNLLQHVEDTYKWDVDEYVAGKANRPQEANELALDVTTWIEFDCERKTVALAKQMGLADKVNLDIWVQSANAYVYGFQDLKERRISIWKDGTPVTDPTVISSMPKHFNLNPFGYPDAIKDAFDLFYGYSELKVQTPKND